MDYEKEYRESLERASHIYNTRVSPSRAEIVKEVLDYVFPQLKEDNDEKIRKELINYFRSLLIESNKQGFNVFINKDFKKYLDWIEKQGNQKPIVPKFKVGDTIVEKDLDECGYGTIEKIKDGCYIFTNGSALSIKEQNCWKLIN